MTQKPYTSHNQIPKTLVEYFEGVAKAKIVDIDLESINGFVAMMEDRIEKTYLEEEAYQEAS